MWPQSLKHNPKKYEGIDFISIIPTQKNRKSRQWKSAAAVKNDLHA